MVHTQETSLGHNLLDNADVRVQRPVPQPLRECSLTRSLGLLQEKTAAGTPPPQAG